MDRKMIQRHLTKICAFFAIAFANSIVVTQSAWTQDPDKPIDESKKLTTDQRVLAEQYRLLEEKLFTLYEFEQKSNPARSQLLERAFSNSQRNMTVQKMQSIVQLLDQSKLKDAESNQQQVLKNLETLLELLQSEDRGSQVRDELERYQEYLKEIERLQRIQKGIRSQAEEGVDNKRLETSQEKVADRTENLGNEIERNEGGPDDAPSSDGAEELPTDSNRDPSENDSDKNGADSNSDADSHQAQGEPGNSDGGEGQPNQGSSGEPSQSENPIRKRIAAAEERMRDAKKKLEEAKRAESIADMKAAEDELDAARKELEEILKQLREEEVERVLAMLEGRFRQMLERQIKVFEGTRKLDRINPDDRLTDFEIKTGKLSLEEKSIALAAFKALSLLREDGSSVAFPETVKQLHEDMVQVTARLASAKVGVITQEIQEEIIETLDYLIEAFVQAQKEAEQQMSQGQGGGGRPGEQPLVDSLAEIKMIRSLQERILKRHDRYSNLLDNPEDLLGETNDPEIRNALERLSRRQKQLTEITRDISIGRNR